MAALENKVSSIGVGEVYKNIGLFLKNKGDKSENTRETYKRGIVKFFEITRQKSLKFLNKNDVKVEFDDFEYFVRYLVDNTTLNNKTINGYVSATVELLRYLHVKKQVEDISCLSSLKMIRLPETNNEYGVLSVEEVWDFANWVKENEKRNSDLKYLLILFCLDTCLRINAVLNIKWSDFEVRDNEVLVKAVDKGNKDFRSKISVEFYNQILELKKHNTDKVFKIGQSTMQDTLNRWKEVRNISESRNIVLHSIRKSGVTFQYRVTSDIMQAKKAAGHSNLTTTQKYVGEVDYGAIGAVSSGGNLDPELYKKVNREDLEKAIANIKGYQALLNLELSRIQKEKNEI